MAKKKCGFDKKPCIETACMHWQHMLGKHPQTGEPLNVANCAFLWHNILLVENSQQQRQTAAAIESLRNEVDASRGVNQLLLGVKEQLKLPGA